MIDQAMIDFCNRTNHGHGIVTLGPGHWLVLETDGSTKSESLRLTDVQLDEGDNAVYGNSVCLAGDSKEALIGVQGNIRSSAVSRGPDGCLYVGISDDEGIYVWRSVEPNPVDVEQLCQRDAWQSVGGDRLEQRAVSDGSVLGDLLFSAAGDVLVTYSATRDERKGLAGQVGLGVYDGDWHNHAIGTGNGLFPPTCALDAQQKLHVVWSDVCHRLSYRKISIAPFSCEEDEKLIFSWARQPVVTVTDDTKVLIAFEHEFSHAIDYAVLDGDEISLFGDDDARLTHGDCRFHRELFHSPQFSRDSHGRIWLFFVNAIRNHVFACRWLGDEWGPITAVGGIRWQPIRRNYRYLPIGRMAAANGGTQHAGDVIPVCLQAEEPLVTKACSQVKVPGPSIPADRKILFLDMQEIACMRGVRTVAHTAEKCNANPLLEPQPGTGFDCRRVFNSGSVIYEDGRFRMWYSAIGVPDKSIPWWHWYKAGYAESDDGVLWRRPGLGNQTGCNSNVVDGLPSMASVYRDDLETDLRQRYKSVFLNQYGLSKEMAALGKLDPTEACYHGEFYSSADGFAWDSQPVKAVAPHGKFLSIVPQCMFRDVDEVDPDKRFKAYGFSSLTQGQRGVSMVYSPDSVNWTAYENNPVLEPELRGHPYVPAGPYGHVHDVAVFKYSGYYLAIFQYLHNPLAADIELAMSRDGMKFTYINPGSKVIERGGAGCWDRGTLLPSVPLIHNDQIWMYYGGTDYHHESDGPIDLYAEDKMLTCAGLAKLRLDGFAGVQLMPGRSCGEIVTLPLQMPDEEMALILNADCRCGSIKAELLDNSTRTPIPGYTLAECVPMEVDSVKHRVQWRERKHIDGGGTTRAVRLSMTPGRGSPELFSIVFDNVTK